MQRATERELTQTVVILAKEQSNNPPVKALFDKLVNDLVT